MSDELIETFLVRTQSGGDKTVSESKQQDIRRIEDVTDDEIVDEVAKYGMLGIDLDDTDDGNAIETICLKLGLVRREELHPFLTSDVDTLMAGRCTPARPGGESVHAHRARMGSAPRWQIRRRDRCGPSGWCVVSTHAEVRAELTKLRLEFMRTHRAVLSAEDREIFEPGDEAHAAARDAREARSVAYSAYLKGRAKARALMASAGS